VGLRIEQFIINYDENWFSKDGEPCCCGTAKNKNPQKKTKGKKATTPTTKAELENEKRNLETRKGTSRETGDGV
jgi:hypothetical protein